MIKASGHFYSYSFLPSTRGGHTHVRVFAGPPGTRGKCGDLCFRADEWATLRDLLMSMEDNRLAREYDLEFIIREDDGMEEQE